VAKRKNIVSKFIFTKTRMGVFLVLAFLCTASLLFSSQIETIINVGYTSSGAELDEAGLQVHFVNVGQGDGIVIELPDGKTMMIDGGPSGNATRLIDYIENNVFEQSAVKEFDYMILTHSDTDHIGAVDEILDAYQVNHIFRPEIYATYNNLETVPENRQSKDTQTYAKVIERVQNEPGATVTFNAAGLTITGGSGANEYEFTFYSPTEQYYSDVNEFSPIVVLEYQNQTVMLTGDATIQNEQVVVQANQLPQIDVLKLGHHGSNTSTSSELLAEIDVTYAVISAGEDNSYGHPHQETINRLIYAGVPESHIFNTAQNGNIIANITTSGQVVVFTQVESLPTYIEWEMVVLVLILIAFYLCFTLKMPKLN
jgi:competence protein ComEC